jgi:hypothetical protein
MTAMKKTIIFLSSLHSFSMKKDGAFCRIADITPMSPPAPSRQPGGTFPSE